MNRVFAAAVFVLACGMFWDVSAVNIWGRGKNGEWDNDDDPPQRKMPRKGKRPPADAEYETNADEANDPPVADNRQNDAKPNQTDDMPPWRLARLARQRLQQQQKNSASSVDTPMIRPTCAPAAAVDPGPRGTPSTPQACFADGADGAAAASSASVTTTLPSARFPPLPPQPPPRPAMVPPQPPRPPKPPHVEIPQLVNIPPGLALAIQQQIMQQIETSLEKIIPMLFMRLMPAYVHGSFMATLDRIHNETVAYRQSYENWRTTIGQTAPETPIDAFCTCVPADPPGAPVPGNQDVQPAHQQGAPGSPSVSLPVLDDADSGNLVDSGWGNPEVSPPNINVSGSGSDGSGGIGSRIVNSGTSTSNS